MSDIDVLYIAGSGRSGSTLLDMILGQVDGFVGTGEMRYLWQRGILDDRLCGCGERFGVCPHWTAVLDAAGIVDRHREASRMLELQQQGMRVRHVPAMLYNRRDPGARLARLDGYGDSLGRLYRALAEVSGAQVIVDSSKLPAYGFLLSGVPGIHIHIVHLVRDPRATAYSWLRKKVQPDRPAFGYMEPQSVVRSAVLWATWNTSARLFWEGSGLPYLLVRYEDFVESPSASMQRILEMVGCAGHSLPFADESTVHLGRNHTVAGNPNRLQTGMMKIRGDDEWKARMRPRDRRVVTMLTAPALRRFGYK